jgi:hypothetical protein
MTKIRVLSFSILILTGSVLFASENDTVKLQTQYLFSLNSGYSNQMIRDEAVSPFIYKGITAPVDLNYQYLNNTTLQLFTFQFSQARLKSKIPDYPDFGLVHHIKSITIDLRYSYLTRLTSSSNWKMDLFCGGEINSFLNTRDHFFTSDNNYLMVDCFNSLSFSAVLKKQFNQNNRILLNVSVPLVSYVLMRQTYNAYVGEKTESLDLGKNVLNQLLKNGDFVSVNKLFDIRADLTWVKYLGKHFGVSLKYSFHYYKFTQYDNLFYSRNLNNQLLAGFLIKL